MSLINNLLGKIFGKNQNEAETVKQTNDDYMARWEKEREERIKTAEGRLKDWIIAAVKEKGSLIFSWESGNDEAFLTFENNTDTNETNFEDLEEYMIDKLDIPDAGEFQMNGNGTIYMENNVVRVKYNSTIKETIDFNEETEEEIFSEEEHDCGDKILFAV